LIFKAILSAEMMEQRLNLRELMSDRKNYSIEMLEDLAHRALLHPDKEVKEENLEYLADIAIVPGQSEENWVAEQRGPEERQSYYIVKSVFVEDGSLYLLLEHNDKTRKIAFLCDAKAGYKEITVVPDFVYVNVPQHKVSEEQLQTA
jgi:hypothetical protein